MISSYYWYNDNNFGDMLVPHIVKYLTGEEVIQVTPSGRNKYLIIGSEMPVIGIVYPGDTIWGYGTRYEREIILPEDVNVLAVRGHVTERKMVNKVSGIAFGDPGSIMPLIYTPKRLERRYDIGVMLHHRDRTQGCFNNINDPNVLIIDLNKDPLLIIDQINSCAQILTTSLHGCVVAEAYGVPCSWALGYFHFEDEGFEIKFNDYFSSSGRSDDIKPNIIKEYTLETILYLSKKILPKPIINVQPLLKAWGDFHLSR